MPVISKKLRWKYRAIERMLREETYSNMMIKKREKLKKKRMKMKKLKLGE